jgi:hypothetical protein
METINEVKRSKLWNDIYDIVKQIPRKDVDGDALDASSATTSIEEILVKTKHVLTNRDISEQYRDIKLYLMIQDFTSAFAYCATRQDNCGNFELVANAIKAYTVFLKEFFIDTKNTVIVMDYERIRELTSDSLFESIPEIMALNEMKPDFICLGALSRNVFYHILRDKITQPL